jgi:hypothetical protein
LIKSALYTYNFDGKIKPFDVLPEAPKTAVSAEKSPLHPANMAGHHQRILGPLPSNFFSELRRGLVFHASVGGIAMKKTAKRLYLIALTGLGVVAATAITAAPALAGTRLNHSESLAAR